MLKEDGGIKAMLEMVRSGNNDVVAQVARGLANFAKCESRATVQGSSMSLKFDTLCRLSTLHNSNKLWLLQDIAKAVHF